MNRSALLTAALIFGIQFGWSEFRKGETEYIIQVDEEVIEALRAGESFSSAIPPQLQNVTRVRLQFGTEPPGQPRMSYFGNRELGTGQREVLPSNAGAGSQAGQDPVLPSNYRGRDLTQEAVNGRPSGALAERINTPPDYGNRGFESGNAPPLLPPNQPQGSSRSNEFAAGNSQDLNAANGWNSRDQGGVYPPNDRGIYPAEDQRVAGNVRGENQDRSGGSQVLPPAFSPVDIGGDGRFRDGNAGSQFNPLPDPLGSRDSIADELGVQPGPLPASGNTGAPPTIPSATPLLPQSRLTENIPDSATGILLNGAGGETFNYGRSADERRWENGNLAGQRTPGGFPTSRSPIDRGHPLDRQIDSPADDRGEPQVAENRNPGTDSRNAADDKTSPVSTSKSPGSETADAGTPTKTQDAPWLLTFFLLCLSMGGNVYLTWIARGSYLRYRELSDQQRRASLDRIMLE